VLDGYVTLTPTGATRANRNDVSDTTFIQGRFLLPCKARRRRFVSRSNRGIITSMCVKLDGYGKPINPASR